jgi:hypothetical protein
MTRQKGGILPEKATPSFFGCQSARDLPRSTASLAREGRDVKTCEGGREGGEGKRRSKGRGNKEEATKVGQKGAKDGSPSATETFGVWENRPLKPARVYRTRGKFGSPLPTYFARSALI